MKAMKLQSNVQANAMNAWEYEAEKRQQKKANKSLRDLKKGRKMQWQIEA